MNAPHNQSRSSGARRAWAQPRFLLGAAAVTLAGATWASFAAPSTPSKSAVAMPHTSGTSSNKLASLSDLPELVARYGESRRVGAIPTTGSRTTKNVGTGATGFNLSQSDLTPNSPSDEREPVVSPGGDFIAFTSTGADTNNDGAIDSLGNGGSQHIWIMNRNGSGQRQITGLGTDAGRSQTHPTWSPDGNQIAYSDQEPDTLNGGANPNAGGSQLFVVSALDVNPTPTQRTFFGEDNISKSAPAVVQSPAWAPSGLSIAFVTNYDGRQDGRDDTAANPRSLPTRDIFSIAPDGTTSSLTRITGDASTDPVGNTSDEDHPSWATVNTNVLFYSSNRDKNGVLTGNSASGRRIWRIFADGTVPSVVTDPLQRSNGQGSDQDDYPASSLRSGTSSEQVAFQTNTYLDDSDQADGARGRDLNIWTIPVSTNSYNPIEARTYVGSYDNGQILGVNTRTLQPSGVVPRIPANVAQNIPNVEDVLVSPDGQYVFAADRNNKRVLRFNEADGTEAGSSNFAGTGTPPNAAQFTPSNITNPVGLAIYGQYLYVTSGYTNTNPTPAIYRFDLSNGAPAPSTANSPDTTGIFSNGDSTGSGVIANGAEGIAITKNGRYIAVADLTGNKINLYDRSTGAYLFNAADNTTFVVPDATLNGGLSSPTGLTWGPDLNSDGNDDLYICSSGSDAIKVYSGPDASGNDPFVAVGGAGSSNSTRPGTFIGDLISEPDGSDGAGPGTTGLNGPERIRIADLATSGTGAFGGDGTPEVYVSSFRTLGVPGSGVPGGGFQVNRYGLDVANAKGLPWPAGANSPLSTPVNAAWISLPSDPNNPNSTASLSGAASFDFNLTTRNQAAGVGKTITADEKLGSAQVLTNILSSPTNFTASRLTSPQDVDRSADREPSFSRTTATAQTISRLVFASNRLYAPGTGSNGATTQTNPSGGDGNAGTHDIWSTSTKDTTPPALVPQGAGNLQYPVVAPQPNAPFFAPRTAEVGLKAGLTPNAAEMAETANPTQSSANTYARRGGLRFAVVLRDAESGLQETTSTTTSNAVSVRFYDADSQQFVTSSRFHRVNEKVDVPTTEEVKAANVAIGGLTSFALNVYDDGPIANGGHEQQAGAVAGDGNFYCEGLLPTPGSAGDFYIDVTATDRTGNSLNYDNVWGISTRRFARQTSGKSDLFVSDYTCGQNFPYTLGNDSRFANMPPVESYYLTNPVGPATNEATPPVVFGTSILSTFSTGNVDVWRILCRGPVTQDVLNAYRPSVVKQIDPNNPNPAPNPTSTPLPGATASPTPTARPTAVPTATPLPFSQLTRNVAVANSSVIWASPYAGTVFAGPGTIADPTTQANLTSFLSDGGRLFLSGRDVAFALSSSGSVSNTFLSSELAANFSGEGSGYGVAAVDGGFLRGRFIPFSNVQYSGDFLNLQFPSIYDPDNGNYEDSALTQTPGSASDQFDVLSPQSSAGVTLKTDYSGGGGVVGQRIQHDNRNNGLQSRAVFFSFGFEAVNRRYTQTTGFPQLLQTRFSIANSILEYFKTSGVSGTVINNATNLPVPNFLIRVDGDGGTFFARTDVNGNYSITGLPSGGYTVRPYLDSAGLTSPQGFFGGTPVGFGVVGGGAASTGNNLRVIPAVPGAIIGRAVTSNGTFTNRADDTPIPNLPVLVRSVGQSSIFPNGGQFARLATTNATGDFSIAGVPALAEMQVIFNPALNDIPSTSNVSYAGPNPNFGRRLLPDMKRPLNAIIVPSGDNFILNDTGTVTINGSKFTVDTTSRPDTPADERVPVLVPSGPTISGVVSVNGTGVSGATVQLFKTDSSGAATSTQVTNPVQTSGSGGKTGTDGSFSFVDVSAAPRNGTAGGTKYVIRTTITRDNATLTRDVTITLFQGEDLTVNVDFVLATLTGKVVQGNNIPVNNAVVVLQNADGSTFVPTRTAKTNASGIYSIPNVPVGGYTYNATTKTFTQTSTAASATVRYIVSASLGSLTGNSGVFSVRATDTTVTVPTIKLVNQQLTGLVQLQVDGNPATNLSGAAVELLDGNGNSLSTPRTTTTGSDGTYFFANVTAGTYRVRAMYRGDTTTSAPFTATSGAYMVNETLRIQLHTIYGTTFDTTTTNGRAVGATVTLSQNGTVIQSVQSVTAGSFQFAPVAAASNYVLRATKGTLFGTANVPAITRTAQSSVGVNIYMKVSTTGTPNATSFDKGRTYSFSTPYATSANAATRNAYVFMDRNNATVALSDVFNYIPLGTNAAGNTVRFYTVSRFNPNTLAYEPIPDNGLLSRGEGYLLRVTDVPASGEKLRFATPDDNSALQALTSGGDSVTKRFYVNLIYNDSTSSNGLNGRNFIGFGFDPSKYGSVVWDNTSTTTNTGTPTANATTSVQVQYGGKTYTIKDAATAGLIYPSLTTTDSSTGRSVISPTVNSFGGYFVQARKSGVRLLFQFPQANSN